MCYCFIQFSSVAQSCPTLCDPMDCSMPRFPVQQQLLELAKTHVYRVGDAMQPSHPLSSPSSAFTLSQHQGLFQWVSSSHQVVKVLELQLQDQSHEYSEPISSRIDWLDLLTVPETLKSLLQHHSSKASIASLRKEEGKILGLCFSNPVWEGEGPVCVCKISSPSQISSFVKCHKNK